MTDQQQDILRAATGLLADGGSAALRVRDIAEAAGCSTMGVYSHFGGKDGLIEAIFIDGFNRFGDALDSSWEADPDLLALGVAYRMWALENPGHYRVMFTNSIPGFAPTPETQLVGARSFEVLVDGVIAGQADKVVRAGDPVEIAWGFWGLTHGLVMLELAGIPAPFCESDPAEVFVAAIQTATRGIRPT